MTIEPSEALRLLKPKIDALPRRARQSFDLLGLGIYGTQVAEAMGVTPKCIDCYIRRMCDEWEIKPPLLRAVAVLHRATLVESTESICC